MPNESGFWVIIGVMKRYNPAEIEPKWQLTWQQDSRYKAPDISSKPKYYVSSMFPYPSGAGMHAGHFFEHSIVDAVARFRRALGYNVMYPMGFDSFGLPAENYAIKTGKTPQETTQVNIANFKNQLNRVGASIDWSRELNTADPSYYKWTQWIFTQLYARNLAYQKEAMQWWCPKDKTVLANEQVIDGRCWRCNSIVGKKSMKQWFFKITDYADALLEGLPGLNWPNKIKVAQSNWIGRSEGAEVEFLVADTEDGTVSQNPKSKIQNPVITVFTTRPDTLFGATFLALAPEHPLAKSLVNDDTKTVVLAYIDQAVKKSEIERQSEGKQKTGVFTGSYAINPVNGAKVPIWVADYVLGGYGTGAVMGVPGHDERDYEFAKQFDLPIVQVVARFLTASKESNQVHPDQPFIERSVAQCIIRHPSEDKVLILRVNGHDWTTLPMGGIEAGEDWVEGAKREIYEETGYKNLEFVKIAGQELWSEFYAEHKMVNRRAHFRGLEFQLKDLEQDPISEEESTKHVIEWVSPSEALQQFTEEEPGYFLRSATEPTNGLYQGEGKLINSGAFDGLETSEAREEIVAWLEQQGLGRVKVTYKMRDWLISRQRYWGAPIPIIHCSECGVVPVPNEDLPVLLPEVEDFAPRGDGKSVLAAQEDWVNVACPKCGGPAKRETDTMDGYACSSWYLLRYTDPHNDTQAWDPKLANHWSPLDMYLGGDHAVAHLLYVRFWTHVFKDMGLTDFKEPVSQLVYHGLIQAEDGRKMSKSYGNVVDPLEVIDQGYGADALRTFELFLGPINEDSNWSSRGITGVYRFINRVWTLTQEYIEAKSSGSLVAIDSAQLTSLTHAAIKKVTDDINRLSFNTAIAAMMEFTNELYKLKTAGFSEDWQFTLESLLQILQPFAPHMAAELWEQLGHSTQLDFVDWPQWDDGKIVKNVMTIVVQVDGKVRAKLDLPAETGEEAVKQAALSDQNVQKFLQNQKPAKVIYIPGRLVSVVL